jgi:thymidylate synthase ThyX
MIQIKVEYLRHSGDDLAVVDAARTSFDKQSEWDYSCDEMCFTCVCGGRNKKLKSSDEKLIKYLANHKHYSPFNHSFISVRVTAPVFVARQLVKHKFMPFNEVSRRYVTDTPEFYKPDRWRKAAPNVKQGSSATEFVDIINSKWKRDEGTPSERRNPCTIKFARLGWRVKAEGLPFDLNIEDVEWNEVCPLMNIPLNYDVSRGGIFDDTPTFDKIYPDKGYVKGNVRVISDLANRMKSSATPEQLETFARATLLEWKGEVGCGQSPEKLAQASLKEYERLLSLGVCAEQARQVLPQSMMTTWIWSGTLGAFCDMLVLRLDEHTQYETRVVAQQVAEIVKELFPVSYVALVEDK